MQKIIVSVTNDLTNDQRVHKVCTSLHRFGYDILLVGRKLENSLPLERDYNTHRIDLFFKKGVFFYAEYNFRLFFYLLFKKKTILVSNDLDTLLPNYLVSKLQKKKLVYDSHELFTEVPELINRPKTQKIWLQLERIILPKLKNTYTVCDSIANYYKGKYKVHFKVVRNVPVLEKSELRKKNKDQKVKIIIYQGAVNLGRGLELMIDTMPYLENYKFHIVGDGDVLSNLKNKVKQQKLESKVLFLGKKTPSELKKITPKATIGISIEEDLGLNYKYALPNKLFDYIHASIPVLVSNLPEMSAVVEKYNIGKIVTNRTPKFIVKQILKMENWENESLQKNLKKARTELQWKKEEKILQNIFNNLN